MRTPLLEVQSLHVHFQLGSDLPFGVGKTLRAVNGIDFSLASGETLGIVGESGCGKSTLARAVLRLLPITSGEVRFLGEDLATLTSGEMRKRRRQLQLIFQDPLASLNPRMTVAQIIDEPLRAFEPELDRGERQRRVMTTMERVGLLPNQINRYPHEFSGGQAQRIGIARALVLDPALIVCDEPVSALDVSIKSQIINLLQDLQSQLGLALLFIAHDLAVVRQISHRVMVLYLGRVVEIADSEALYCQPLHPYTRALLAAVPDLDPIAARMRPVQPLNGESPSPVSPPSGCVFRTRCPLAIARCEKEIPVLRRVAGSEVACHRAEDSFHNPVY